MTSLALTQRASRIASDLDGLRDRRERLLALEQQRGLAGFESSYEPVGACADLFEADEPEVLTAGPAGTGKSRACLEKINRLCWKHPRTRALIVRKTRESLTQSGIAAFERDVATERVRWFTTHGEFRYPNGSKIVAGGMDKVGRVMSTEYDLVYAMEATELTEEDWEHLLTRVRGQVLPDPQIIGCCNPAGPNHWLKKRAEAGKLRMLDSRHQDNPVLYRDDEWTDFGLAYLAKLDALTGVRYQRLRKGLWVAAEGMVYGDFDWNVHVIPRREIPKTWRRLWAVDFGYTHPFVWQAWAKDEDGRLYRFAELYHTGLLVEDVATRIKEWMARTGEDFPEAIICDHDAEGRATLEKHLGVPTIPAQKSVSVGVQAVTKRLQQAEDGRPRVFLICESAIAKDATLVDSKQPVSTEEEFELYLWQDGIKDSVPVKQHDHGMDALRYLVMHVDGGASWSLDEIRNWGAQTAEPPATPAGPAATLEEDERAAYEAEVQRANLERMRSTYR